MKNKKVKFVLVALAMCLGLPALIWAQKPDTGSIKIILGVGPQDYGREKNDLHKLNPDSVYNVQVRIGGKQTGTTFIDTDTCDAELTWDSRKVTFIFTPTTAKIETRIFREKGGPIYFSSNWVLNNYDTTILRPRIFQLPPPKKEKFHLWFFGQARTYAMFGPNKVNRVFGQAFTIGVRNWPWSLSRWGLKLGVTAIPSYAYKGYEELPATPENPPKPAGWQDCNCGDADATLAIHGEATYRQILGHFFYLMQFGIMYTVGFEQHFGPTPTSDVTNGEEWRNPLAITGSARLYTQFPIGNRGQALTLSSGPTIQGLAHANHIGWDLLNLSVSLPSKGAPAFPR